MLALVEASLVDSDSDDEASEPAPGEHPRRHSRIQAGARLLI
jgi:hypothetical protein